MSMKPTILCVDDEINVLEGMKINLRKAGRVLTAQSGAEGLKMLDENPEIAVIISDMRMPEMDGATFLSKVNKLRPDTVRILLTGFSDMEAAVRAVNEGQLFRFLTKPCPPEMLQPTIQAAIEQHRLITAEKELLQRTLLGSVHALIEVLALDNPQAIGRAMRIRRRVREIARNVGVTTLWPSEFAAIFSQLGLVSLPDDLRRKVYYGHMLDEQENQSVARNINSMVDIVSKIPRLDPAIDVLKRLAYQPEAEDALPVRVIRAAMLLETCESRGMSQSETAAMLQGRSDVLGDELVHYCSGNTDEQVATIGQTASVAPADLAEGMVLMCDLVTANDVLLAPRGLTLNASTIEHIGNFVDRIDADSIEVRMAEEPVNQRAATA